MIIYPPYIADTIPAFTTKKVEIPFVMNPALDIDQIKYFQIRVTNYIDSELVGTVKSTTKALNYNKETKNGIVTFYFNNTIKPIEGQYYKFQLSFSDSTDENNVEFYSFSTASLGRCIGDKAPVLKITGRQNKELSETNLNVGSDSFSGYYSTTLLSEPIYNYRFYIYNKNTKEIIQDTGWLLHNVDNDDYKYGQNGEKTHRISQHDFILKYELENWVYYSIVYQIKTVNGFIGKIECPIIKQGSLPIAFEGKVKVSQSENALENGYVQIDIEGRPIKGKFELQRTSNNKEWNTLTTFETTELSDMSIFSWKDWSVEQGVTYTYAIRQTANGQYSERLKSSPVQIEFNHMFLSDGKRQLKIAFNPKVSSIKDVILENKMDTIGSKYPFFFRNDTVRYKELPISGLISYLSDDNELFLTNEELGLTDPKEEVRHELLGYNNDEITKIQKPRTTNLFGYNFEAERKFKLAVMDWLNNGEPKLFRSPAEGNYIVRTMNVSLSPSEQVGRMLHTFSSTAYEIMEYSIDNLQKYKIIDLANIKDPDPEVVTTTYTFDKLSFNALGICDLTNLIKNDNTVQKMKNKTITNIIWHSARPDINDYIEIDGHKYYNNVTGIFQTPYGIQYEKIKIKKPTCSENYGSSITITYVPDLSLYQGKDSFQTMVSTSDDILFTVPAGYYFRKSPSGITSKDNCVLYIKPGGDENSELTCVNIYKTYVMVVRKDENYVLKTQDDKTDPYLLKFFTKNYYDNADEKPVSIIDFSDGQIRYFNNIEADLFYEKGAGLTIDLYACVGGQRNFNSSALDSFLLNNSMLGG